MLTICDITTSSYYKQTNRFDVIVTNIAVVNMECAFV